MEATAGTLQPPPAPTDFSLASLVTLIVGTPPNHVVQLSNALRGWGRDPDVRETIMGSLLQGGQDPLAVLDVAQNTLGVLWILSARLGTPTAAPTSIAAIEAFCAHFDPIQARLAPERVTHLARGIVHLAESTGRPKLAIRPLYDLLQRYPPNTSYLTTLHPIFLQACLLARHTPPVYLLPILSVPIEHVSTDLSDLSYTDNLIYHFLGGCILAGLKRWALAEEFFEICIGNPGHVASAIQWDALKKLVLVQCIFRGQPQPLPKYIHPSLSRMLKSSPYGALVKSFPSVSCEKNLMKSVEDLAADGNVGLARQAVEAAVKWRVKNLTGTYVSLGLEDVAKEAKIASADEAREIVVSMIADGTIAASLDADGAVTFSDSLSASAGSSPGTSITKADVSIALRAAQSQALLLAALDRDLGASREFITKAVKSKDDDRWGNMPDEELFGSAGAPGAWAEEGLYQ